MEASTIMAPPSDVRLESAIQLVDGTSCCLLLANQRKRPATIASTAQHTAAAFRLLDHQQSGLAKIHCQCPAAHKPTLLQTQSHSRLTDQPLGSALLQACSSCRRSITDWCTHQQPRQAGLRVHQAHALAALVVDAVVVPSACELPQHPGDSTATLCWSLAAACWQVVPPIVGAVAHSSVPTGAAVLGMYCCACAHFGGNACCDGCAHTVQGMAFEKKKQPMDQRSFQLPRMHGQLAPDAQHCANRAKAAGFLAST